MKQMKRILFTTLAALGLAVIGTLFVPEASPVLADAKSDVCSGLQTTGAGANCTQTGPTVESVIKTVIEILSWIVGIASVIMIIVGGFKYVTSGGDSSNVQSAKHTIIYAIVGIVIVAFAQTILKFVIEKLF